MTVQESGLGGKAISDSDVLRFATTLDRTLITLNRRHFVRLHEEGSNHAGIIACTADNDFVALAARIDRVLLEKKTLPGQLVRVHREG